MVPHPGSITFLYLLSLFHPILVRLHRLCRRIPCPLQVNVRYLLPPHPHPFPWCHSRPLAQFQKRSCINLMRNRVLSLPNVLLRRLKICLFHYRRRQGVLSLPAWPSLRELTCQTNRVTWYWNPSQDSDHGGVDHPYLCAKEQYRLNHGFKEKSGHPRLLSLPACRFF